MADVKGDLTGIAAAGQSSEKLQARLEKIGVSDLGAARQPGGALGYLWREGSPGSGDGLRSWPPAAGAPAQSQRGAERRAEHYFSHRGRPRPAAARLQRSPRHHPVLSATTPKAFQNQYGNISSASIGAIQRGLLTLEQQGAEHFFGEPMLDIADWMRVDASGKG
ncbi:nucleotide triphosphate hydrolase domain-containing protein [Klebsiella variicola]|uniref:Nucleotide triphosphate hydrolase domain-containing protein n=1 Tax=Klebsiella variicola TaxID=244366 RepID=A0A7H4MC93_KLEVA|nr:nucleotide triphosphate hydrolase domain-containing protein [Klebsiella variicola]